MTSAQSTSAEREAAGKAARREAPRSGHAKWEPAADRPDPVAVLEEESAARVPELVPIRYGRMLASPFTFFRGAAAIMAADLARSPRSGIVAQLCGDAHLSNFGVFAAPDRRLVFDLNDFDETHEGPWEWDVKRLAASIEIGGRDRGFTPRQRRTAVLAAVRRYREAMCTLRRDAEPRRLVRADGLRRRARRGRTKRLRQGGPPRGREGAQEGQLAGACPADRDGRRSASGSSATPPLIERVDDLLPEVDARELEERMQALLDTYAASLPDDLRRLVSSYRFVDMARKVVGVGSVGTRAWIILLEGRDGADPLVLQAKEAEASVLEEHVGESTYANHGERVVRGQRLMQAASDILLGWVHTTGIDGRPRDFYVRQLWDGKGSADVTTMSPERLARYGELCGWALARAHARSGDRIAIAAYLGSGDAFDRALADFAELYAEQNDADYSALEQAVSDGRLSAEAG